MPCRAEILTLSALLIHALPAVARPAAGGVPGWTEGTNGVGNIGNFPEDHDYDYGLPYEFTHSPQQAAGDGPDGHCGGGRGENGGYGGGGQGGSGDGGYLPTVTVSDCSAAGPTSTVTITIGDDGSGTATITETLSSCTATVTVDNGNNLNTVTVTDTVLSSITECIATITDFTTMTVDGPTTTETITTKGPTITSTVTTGGATVTEPGSTSTETSTVTETSTETDTTTITNNQIITSTQTVTQTDTLEVTTTITSDTCSGTDGSGGNTIDYGTCSDPYIIYKYGLDGRTEYAYTTRNQADFPFGSSPTIGSVDDLICNRLRSPCNAPQATIDLCYEAQDAVANLSGQEAADVWNAMMT